MKKNVHILKKSSIWMLFLLFFSLASVQAQIAANVILGSGTTTPALLPSYSSFGNLTAALNNITAMNGPIYIAMGSGNETAPAKGFTIGSTTLNAVLSATNIIVITGAGNTITNLNAGVGTATAANASPDGILKLVGADYISIESIGFNDGNTASATVAMEFGVALFKASATDGCKFNNIQGCNFNMQRINSTLGSGPMGNGQAAIMIINALDSSATTIVTPTATSGLNTDNYIGSNFINGGNTGIIVTGYNAPSPYTLVDARNQVEANTIENFGGGGVGTGVAFGIITSSQWESVINFNFIDNNTGTGVNSAGNLYGIIAGVATNSNCTVNDNIIKLQSAATTGLQVMGINCVAANGGNQPGFLVQIARNSIEMSQPLVVGAAPIGVRGISCVSSSQNVSIINNTIAGIGAGFGSTGFVSGIYYDGAATLTTINNNTIRNFIRSGASGTTYGIFAKGSSATATATTGPTNVVANGNTVDNLTFTATDNSGVIYGLYTSNFTITNTINNNIIKNLAVGTSGVIFGILDNGLPGAKVCQNNQVFNFSTPSGIGAGSSNAYNGIYFTNATSSALNVDISGNSIYSLNSSGTGTNGRIEGIRADTNQPTAIYNNKIYDLSYAGTNVNGTVSGILTSQNVATIYNNVIADLRIPNYNQTAQKLFGINLNSVANLYYNTVSLSGTNASSAALIVSTAFNVMLRNNIFINKITPNAGGTASAYLRNSTNLATYDASSNNNLFAGTNIYSDFTNTDATLAAFKTRMATRDQASVTEVTTPFTSVIGSNVDFLRLPTNAVSVANNTALPITSPAITTDYFGVTRSTTTPDIGASEFNGLVCTLPVAYAITGGGAFCAGGTGLAVGVSNSEIGMTYQLKIGGTNTGTTIAGTGAAFSFPNQTVAGTYTVDANNSNAGCPQTVTTMTGTAIITSDPTTVGGSVAGTATKCSNTNSGTVTLSGNTGAVIRWESAVSPFSTWTAITNTSLSNNYTNLSATTQFRAVVQSGSCASATSSVATITVSTIAPTFTFTNVSCFGGSNGTRSYTGAAGVAPYTYLWSTGATTNAISGLVAGTYTCTISDAVGCSQLFSTTVTQPSALTATTSQTNVACNGDSNGTAAVSVSGGTSGYTYSWSPSGGTAAIASGLIAGNYTCTITDANGCTASRNFTITQPASALSGSTVVTNISCNGGTNGAINLTPSGGTGSYTFNWGGGIVTEDRTGLAAGIYSVIITDANGCTRAVSGIIVTQPTAITGSTVVTNVACNGGTNGAINLTPTGGTPGYTFNWGGGITTEDRTGLAAGTYTVTITDANGCTSTVSATITQPAAVTPTFTQVAPICSGGTLAALPTTSNNSIVGSWSPALDNTTTNTYTFAPNTGQCGTSATMTITVNTTAQPTRDMSINGTLCNNATIGTLISKFNNSANVLCYAAASGGSPLSASLVIAPVNANVTFYLTQTIAGCESTRVLYNAVVNFVTPPTAAATQSFCTGATVANLVATPGTAGSNAACCLNWFSTSSGGTAIPSSTALATGTYYVGQSHISGCALERTLVNVNVSNPNATITEASGILTTAANSATYQWYQCPSTLISSATSQSYTPLVAGDYKVDVTLNGCTVTSSCFTIVTLTNTEFDTNSFKYYPNPTNGILNVNYSDVISRIQIVNLLGQEVLAKNINAREGQIDMERLPSGTYLVRVSSEDKVKTIKIVKQ